MSTTVRKKKSPVDIIRRLSRHTLFTGTPNPSPYYDHGDIITILGNYVTVYVTGGLVGHREYVVA
jgi:hypothetical protein